LLTTIYLACLVDTPSLADELFYVGHQLVAAKPHASVSWYAVGCYYLLIGKYDHSRHFFRRCTGIDPAFGEAWVGFAHAFALQGEHDQAMAAYRTAARMISNNHIPPLCIAMEYLRVNNVALALKFIDSAQQLCPSDALLFNEMGVAHYKEHEYAAALNCFQKVVALVGQDVIRKRIEWESTLFNMGHVYRKLRNYAEAFKCFSLCLSLKPNNPSTLSAIGLTHHLNSNLDKAIEYYHLSLARSDDAFTSDLLKRALEDFTVNWSK
jgi:anaphase-promoting complex subunit 6